MGVSANIFATYGRFAAYGRFAPASGIGFADRLSPLFFSILLRYIHHLILMRLNVALPHSIF